MRQILLYFLNLIIAVAMVSCSGHEDDMDDNGNGGGGTPSPNTGIKIATSIVKDITLTSATSGGNITDDGNFPLIERGICWNTSENPTINDFKTSDGTGVGTYTSRLINLSGGNTYYVRAYATNIRGTTYGQQVTFNTPGISPTLSTAELSTITSNTALSGGTITHKGGSEIATVGICWNTTGLPTIDDWSTSEKYKSNSFALKLTELKPYTKYYVRAYATNDTGIGYGEDRTFTTAKGVPVLSTIPITEVTTNSAKSGGIITNTGGSKIISCGVCWNTKPTPTIHNPKTSDMETGGQFTSQLTDLEFGKTYYARAYATNEFGTSYGEEISFMANDISLPTLTTLHASDITINSAKLGGNITNAGSGNIIERGIVWSTSSNPTIDNHKISNGTGVGKYIISITELADKTIYYARAYATNEKGTAYGDEINFTTVELKTPELSQTNISNIGVSSVTVKSSIRDNGNGTISEQGFCWSTNSVPTINDFKIQKSPIIGEFSSLISSLDDNTQYYVRAYAINQKGVGYGEIAKFSTLKRGLPCLSDIQMSELSFASVKLSSSVTDNGNLDISARGFCWSTSPNPTIDNDQLQVGRGMGDFTKTISGLQEDTKYHIRSYATNETGTGYSNELTLTTGKRDIPILKTTIFEQINDTSVSVSSSIESSGYLDIIEYGFCWSTSPNSTIDGHKIRCTTSFTANISGLQENTKYYIRSYAINSMGIGYGEENSVYTQPSVSIADEWFKRYCLYKFDTDKNNILSYAEIKDITTLDLGDYMQYIYNFHGNIDPEIYTIRSLDGIKYFTGLQTLNATGGGVKLQLLDVNGCENLATLNCSDNQLTSLDGISNCPNLTILNCRNNQLTSLDGISNCPNLTILDCGNNPLTSLDVSDYLNLTTLNCNYTGGNRTGSLTSLNVNGCTNLTTLDCSNNPLTSLDLSGNPNLITLNCTSNQLTSLNGISNYCPNLTALYCHNNPLTSLDVNGCINLKELYCGANKMTSLDVSGCINLITLACNNNYVGKNYKKLTFLNVNGCVNLTTLECSSNQLTLLEVSKCKNLFKLLCYDNQLTSLNVSQNPKLCILDCGKNQLISLDISKTLIGEVVANYWQLACAMNTLETLYLKTGWQIKYINVNRDSKYISNQTQILYKD